MDSIRSRLRKAWNVFRGEDLRPTGFWDLGPGSSYRPDRPRLTGGNERSIISSVFNRIALDAAAIDVRHVRLDEDGRFMEIIKSDLNRCLSEEANIDQTGRAFLQDVVMSMLDEGVVAIVATETTADPRMTDAYDVLSMRTGKVIEWHPEHVRVNVYNQKTGLKEDIVLRKTEVAIVENPLYAVINERNSTLQRLIRKLNLLDAVDEQSSTGKLNMIIQLPYSTRAESRKKQAELRRNEMEQQLTASKYGIAYADSTEKIVQLNRPLDNNLMAQVEYLTSMLYSQLGMTQSILDGTADEGTMLNYYSRCIEPILSAIIDGMKRIFLSRTARAQKQSITMFRDPFKLVPVGSIAEIADKFTRNEIMTANEIRQAIGMKPSDDPGADELRNKNLSKPRNWSEEIQPKGDEPFISKEGAEKNQNGS